MKTLAILILISSFISCKSSIPENIIPPKKMQAVLWDVMQADELAEYYTSSDSTFKGLARHVDYYQKVFAIHKITKNDFTSSLKYYQEHPASLKPILDSLQQFGQTLEAKDSLSKKPVAPLISDSAKRKLHLKPRGI
jgi:hypothetical protein